MQNPDPCRQLLLGSVYPACCVHGMIEAGTYTVAFPDYCLASSASSAASLHPSWVIRQLGPAPLTTRHPAQTVSGFLGRSSVFRGPHVKSRGSFASSCGACAAKLRAAVHRTVRATQGPGKRLKDKTMDACRFSVQVMSCVLPRSQTVEHTCFIGNFLDSAWSLHGKTLHANAGYNRSGGNWTCADGYLGTAVPSCGPDRNCVMRSLDFSKIGSEDTRRG